MTRSFLLDTTSLKPARLCWVEGEGALAESLSTEVGQFVSALEQHGFIKLTDDQLDSKLYKFSATQYQSGDWVVAIKTASPTVHFSMRSLATGQSVTLDDQGYGDALSVIGMYTNVRFIRAAVGGACGTGTSSGGGGGGGGR